MDYVHICLARSMNSRKMCVNLKAIKAVWSLLISVYSRSFNFLLTEEAKWD